MELEAICKRFYDGLEEGKILGRRCLECGAIEFPPHYACNECGYHATEWVELSGRGRLTSFVLHGTMNARPYLDEVSRKYAFGSVLLDEGREINAVIFGVSKRNEAALKERIRTGERVGVHARITQRDGFKTLYFELDEDGSQ